MKARNLRDALLFVCGLIGIMHEVFLTMLDRPGLLVLFAGMVGLPAYLRMNGH